VRSVVAPVATNVEWLLARAADMNLCSLCNPDNVKKRDEAYRLLASGCSQSAVAARLDIKEYTLQKCWQFHDIDPIRGAQRKLRQAKKRLAKAEAYHKKLKAPDRNSAMELNTAMANVIALEKHLNELQTSAVKNDVNSGAPSIAWLDDLLEKTSARHDVGGGRILGMMNIIDRMPDGPSVADFLWKLLHNRALLTACMKVSVTEKEIHPRVPLGERLAN